MSTGEGGEIHINNLELNWINTLVLSIDQFDNSLQWTLIIVAFILILIVSVKNTHLVKEHIIWTTSAVVEAWHTIKIDKNTSVRYLFVINGIRNGELWPVGDINSLGKRLGTRKSLVLVFL